MWAESQVSRAWIYPLTETSRCYYFHFTVQEAAGWRGPYLGLGLPEGEAHTKSCAVMQGHESTSPTSVCAPLSL